jgi:hypothetical protein
VVDDVVPDPRIYNLAEFAPNAPKDAFTFDSNLPLLILVAAAVKSTTKGAL